MKFNEIYNLILEELTDKQKELTDKYTAKRNKNLSFGSLFKEERNYFSIKSVEVQNIEIPNKIKEILDNAGFYITDYRTGLAMKKAKSGEQKDLRQIKIGKILGKLNQPNLLKQFNERLGTSKKDIQNINFEICVTHNPYDIAGMSTDRNWTSCMNLNDGAYKETSLRQVQYGGMVAYLISTDDKNIEKPYARIAIKRFISKDDSSKFIFLAENKIYGDTDLAKELNFQEELIKILEQSNKLTADIYGKYKINDSKSYSDTYNNTYYYLNDKYNDLTLKEIKYIISSQPISCKTVKYFIKKYPELLKNKKLWINLNCNNIDKELLEIFIKNSIEVINYTKYITKEDLFDLLKKYKYKLSGYFIVYYFLKNPYITITLKDLDYILENYWDLFNEWSLADVYGLYKFNQIMLNKYLEKTLKEYPEILNFKHFVTSQDFPADIIIKYCKPMYLNSIYIMITENKYLSSKNKEILQKYFRSH